MPTTLCNLYGLSTCELYTQVCCIYTHVRTRYRRADYRNDVNPIMAPTEPWEKRNMTYARAYSGGVWWIPEEETFKMW